MINHRRLSFSLFMLLLVVVSVSSKSAYALTDKVRLVWTQDPSTTMTVGWRQMSSTFTEVRYREKGTLATWSTQTSVTIRNFQNTNNGVADALNNSFVTLTGLSANTDYEFEICDTDGCSQNYSWFRTAPATPQAVTFIAGGDSRRDSSNFAANDTARRNGFKLVAKSRPLFVLFSGDFMNDGTYGEWLVWLDEWQLTQSTDGRMYPLIPTHGNHENDELDMVQDIFNVQGPAGNTAFGTYNALSFGGSMMRIWTLNSELEPSVGYSAFQSQNSVNWDAQTNWLSTDLQANTSVTWKIANYHRPLRPHTSGKSEGNLRYSAWAPLFDTHDIDLAIESDSHMVKYTNPINYSTAVGNDEGFTEADYVNGEHGTVFVGEGSWGAPKRPIDDEKSWTMVNNSFWQFKHITVTPSNMDIRTVLFDIASYPNGVDNDVSELAQSEQDINPAALPTGLDLWQPFVGDGPLSLPLTAAPAIKADANTVPDDGNEGGAPDGALYFNNFSDGFNNTYGNMQLVDRGCNDTSTSNWYIFNGQKASMNGYYPSAADTSENCDDWMILPPQDLSATNAITLTFDSDYNFGGPDLELYYSYSYNPSTNADFSIGTTWLPLSFTLPATDGYSVESSGPVVIYAADIPVAQQGAVYIAYRYTSNGRNAGDGKVWELDNIAIVDGEQIPAQPTSETFNTGTLGTWQAVSVASSNTWGATNVDGQQAARMNNQFSFANADDWLVSPQYTVSVTDNIDEFNFDYRYSGATAQVPVSDNFQLLIYPNCPLTGTYTPAVINPANWTLLQDNFPGTEAAWTSNSAIDLSAYDGQTICLAYRYRDAGAATAREWAVDNLALGTVTPIASDPIPVKDPANLRIASFNILLADRGAGQLVTDLATGNDSQAKGIAEIIQRVNPDVIVLNEFDFDAAEAAISSFQTQYLQVSQNGQAPVTYQYRYVDISNTGVQPESEGDPDCDFNNPARGCSTIDENGNGYDDPEDAYGFGNYSGAFGLAVLSKYPIQAGQIKTFRKFLWKDMPANVMPAGFYAADEIDIFRLSSKSHWDIPVSVNGDIVHVLASHPTPPVFDGTEDRNGRRNHDEIRFWEDYVSLTGSDCYIYDDNNVSGCLGAKQRFVIMGDQNADPVNGDSFANAILQLLNNPSVDNSYTPLSSGGSGATSGEMATADFGLRADYVLPSAAGLNVAMTSCDASDPGLSCGIFWPRSGDPLRTLTGSCSGSGGSCASSDHRMVWLDLQVIGDSDSDGISDDVDICPANADSNQADLDHDLTGDACDVDIDGDGIDNSWETQYGFNPNDPSDALLDTDGDGDVNLLEFQNGTNPLIDESANSTKQVPLPLWAMLMMAFMFVGITLRKFRV